jgi:hypothetical protein
MLVRKKIKWVVKITHLLGAGQDGVLVLINGHTVGRGVRLGVGGISHDGWRLQMVSVMSDE